MKSIAIKDLCRVDFDAKGIKASNAVFPTDIEIDYLSDGRQRYLIHILTDGRRIYKTEKESITINSGTLVFLPYGTKYCTSAINVGKPYCKGLSVIFDLIDQNGDPLMIENDTLHVRRDTDGGLTKLCEKMLKCTLNEPDNILEIKARLFRLIFEIAKQAEKDPPTELAPAFEMLMDRYKENLAVKEYADSCHMSESYFRKKFTEYTGRSPIQYRNELRFAEARQLYSNGMTIHEISDELGFFDAGYFSRLYKKCNGHSLREESYGDMI